jgi:hypothetical protein
MLYIKVFAHSVPRRDFILQNQNLTSSDFFESKGILSPIQRIQKYRQLKYCRYVKKQNI